MSFLFEHTSFGFLLTTFLATACGSTIVDPTGGGGSGAATAGGGGAGANGGEGGVGGDPQVDPTGQPPPPPVNAQPGTGRAPRELAVSHLYVGTKTWEGQESIDAWKLYGYDVDMQDTATDFSAHCKPSGGAAPTNVFPDGTGGVDNSFGRNILPILKTASSERDLEASVDMPIQMGRYTLVFDLDGLSAATDSNPMHAFYVEGREKSGDTWLKAPESFSGTNPLLQFPNGYLTSNTWVSGVGSDTLPVKLVFAGTAVHMAIHRPVVSAILDPTHATATRGIISGVLGTEEFLDTMRTILGAVDASLCEGTAVEGVLNVIRQASDIMNDGSQDPGVECNGISIGLGFDAADSTLGALGPPEQPQPDPCSG